MSSLKDKRSSKIELGTAPPNTALSAPAQIVIGRIAGIGDGGTPIIDYPGSPAGAPLPALATARYDLASVGAAVALMFLAGDPAQPIALGLIATPGETDSVVDTAAAEPERDKPPERLVFEAAREIVLQCGRASIVLTRAGKLLLRGAYVSSRSTGMHRITGASVHIN